MKDTKHTPGPWRICEQTRIEADGFGLVANLRGELSPYYETETDANARLIAAAPELLEALRTLVRAVEERNDAAMTMHAGYAATIITKAA